ncbi:LysE family transporter [Spirulina sp. CCNP1310]|uniref:LysE family translocator n=1 Tax=Spirulina sp. CCNP1310 TaxID=3110249 RepID=UPI002B20871D|nr:LysE family transporter [Spirulina sp. CCNP1310]MEA5418650.1 LysE family transporter [Spirulina sp. CCNP1310]
MQHELLFYRGLLFGFSIAAPIGPIGILCIRRTLNEGKISGLISGLGAATADGVYGCIAGFGLTLIADFLVNQKIIFGLIGSLFICYLGIKTFTEKPTAQKTVNPEANLINAYLSTFLLTLTNPITILAFTAIFAGLGLAQTGGNYGTAALLVLGVFLGSMLWWGLLVTVVGLWGERFQGKYSQWVNRIAGTIMVALGLVALFNSLPF